MRRPACHRGRIYHAHVVVVLLLASAWRPAAASRQGDSIALVAGSSSSSSSSSSTPTASSKPSSSRYESPILHGERYKNVTQNAKLSAWETAVADLPDCRKGSWQQMAHGSWHIDAAGEVFYEPSTCKLRRLTADAARACLANKTIAFVGGSLARYQYVNFAYFMAHRQNMQRYGDDPNRPSLVIEKLWANFSQYYTEGSQQMTWEDDAGSAEEHCHCFRLKWFAGSYEHRLLTIKVKEVNGKPSPATVRVLYNQTFGIKKGVAADTAEAVHWNLADNPKPADILVVNLGHWMHHGLKDKLHNYTDAAAAYEPIFAAATDDSRKKTQFIWRTTTHARQPPMIHLHSMSNWNPVWHRMVNSMARLHRWEFYDGHAVTRSMMRSGLDGHWDNLHFLPFVYDQLNDVLLNGIC